MDTAHSGRDPGHSGNLPGVRVTRDCIVATPEETFAAITPSSSSDFSTLSDYNARWNINKYKQIILMTLNLALIPS